MKSKVTAVVLVLALSGCAFVLNEMPWLFYPRDRTLTRSSPEAYAKSVPGLTSSAPGSQAALLAAQTGPFDMEGLVVTIGSAQCGAE